MWIILPPQETYFRSKIQRSSNHWDIHQGKPFLLFCAFADQPARPNESEKIRLNIMLLFLYNLVGYIKRAREQLNVNQKR